MQSFSMNGSPTCTAPRLLLGRFLGQILRRKRRTCQAVPPRRRADVKHRITDSLGRAPGNLTMP